MSFSILILTYNEDINMERCLDAIRWCDDIVILDSYSTDNTLEIARARGARLYQRKFDTFASQRNFALDEIEFKYEWIFHIDADEVFTEALRNEIEEKIQNSTYDAYQVPSKTMFMGRWLRYSGMYPTYQVRLGRFRKLKFKQFGHGQKEDISPDRIGVLTSPYVHYNFSKGLSAWFEKHNIYSGQEAENALSYLRQGNTIKWRALLSPDTYQRRNVLKQISYMLPCRPFLRFIYMYIFRMGFLDGKQGFLYCALLSFYEFMISIKIEEKSSDERRTQ